MTPSRQLVIDEQRIFRGPNRYDHGQGILLVVDLGDLEDEPSNTIDNFNESLLDLLPTLQDHTCSYGTRGGFVRRLTEDQGTWLGHVFEHVAIEIQNLAGIEVTYGKTRQVRGEIGRTGKESVYRVYFEYANEETAVAATDLALDVVNYLVDPENVPDFDFKAKLEDVIRIADRFAYGPSTGSIVREASSRGIPSIRLEKESSLVQFGWGNKQKRIWASTSSNSSYISTEIAQDKELTLQLLYDVGIPVPRGGVARTLADALREVERVGFPLVTKPLDVSHGRGVTLNIRNAEELKHGFELAQQYARSIIVERYVTGYDFRVLVINGRFVAAAQRIPAHVIGDGEHTVEHLIEEVNQDPRRGVGHEKVLTRITIDENSKRLLGDQNMTLQSVPDDGQFVQLKSTANLSTGGTARDVSDIIHFDNIQLAERAVKTIGLDIAGVDIITNDITTPIKTNGGVIIEVNAAPGFRMHLEPTEGSPRNVAKPVIDMLFPDDDGRIPIVAITGTNGKTTVSRWIKHILKLSGKKVGLTTTDGIYIDGTLEYAGDCTGPWSAKVVLRDPTVDFAVLETARGGILREGLGWDLCDVGVFLNVADDHLGLRGVDTLDEMADIKAVVLDQVRTDGIGVINADDSRVFRHRDRIRGTTTMVSLDYKNPRLVEHTKEGGSAVTITPNGIIQLIQGQSQTGIIHIKEVPAAFGGHAVFNVQNAMFAVAATHRYTSIEDLRAGLSTFTMNYAATPGRMNVERIKGARVFIDYGHNPAALEAQIQLVEGFTSDQGGVGRTAIVFGIPGDRPDSTIIAAAKAVAHRYDRYFIKEDWNLRGRDAGEVVELLSSTLKAEGIDATDIEVFSGDKNELDAVDAVYEWMDFNDIVMLQADDIIKVRNHLLVDLAKMTNKTIEKRVVNRQEPSTTPIDFASLAKKLDVPLDEPSD